MVSAVAKTRNMLDRDILVERFGAQAVHEFERGIRYTEVNVSEARAP